MQRKRLLKLPNKKKIMNNKTIEQLEGNYWDETHNHESLIVIRCLELRKKPISDLTVEDLRMLISQDIGLVFIIPRAIEILKTEPFVEGDYYEGDLLKSVLTSDKLFWQKNTKLKLEVENIMEANLDEWRNFDTTEDIKQKLFEAYEDFKNSKPITNEGNVH